jgi:succinyl-CoA synthetase alpha subunit
MSRSASLTSEVVSQLTAAGLGQSTTVGIGGDPIHGMGFVDCLELFFADPQTEAIVLIGEIGGTEEQQAAEYLQAVGAKKPIISLIVGQHAPLQRRMGHAGALAQDPLADAASKVAALRQAGATIVPSAHLVGATTHDLLAKRAA